MTADLAGLRHPLVRDLAWLLHAPDLLTTPFAGRPSLGELGLEDPQRRRAWLQGFEQAPQTIEARVGPSLVNRLGLYHERLWHFLLDQAPDTRLLAHNLTIRDTKRTLGELDLLYRHRRDAQPVHLELAIKYYLGLPQGPETPDSQARWIGPGCADSLAIKRQHAIDHQLSLALRPEAAEALAPFDAPPLTPRLALLGLLFRPWSCESPLPAPREIAPGALFGDWLALSRWPSFRERIESIHTTRGAFLDKPHWLAPPVDADLIDLESLTGALDRHFAQRRSPRQLILKHADERWQRLFVVGNDWPHRIPLPPPRPTTNH
ncbi:hypothetical protein SAMN02745148_02561 [Modicisalibacter ilicicola DSM 19980]|uniref:DUF1853 domain-containing protein n=2 Tax=Modicisalibacter ilicicola TaxID=480814 RepID=A0A1M5BFT3_9GAMM|nr:hypothetical protein SAMN02745148_02561 [Halomonas ilicicola DSM 19980]